MRLYTRFVEPLLQRHEDAIDHRLSSWTAHAQATSERLMARGWAQIKSLTAKMAVQFAQILSTAIKAQQQGRTMAEIANERSTQLAIMPATNETLAAMSSSESNAAPSPSPAPSTSSSGIVNSGAPMSDLHVSPALVADLLPTMVLHALAPDSVTRLDSLIQGATQIGQNRVETNTSAIIDHAQQHISQLHESLVPALDAAAAADPHPAPLSVSTPLTPATPVVESEVTPLSLPPPSLHVEEAEEVYHHRPSIHVHARPKRSRGRPPLTDNTDSNLNTPMQSLNSEKQTKEEATKHTATAMATEYGHVVEPSEL